MVADIALLSGIYWFMAVGLWINLRIVRYADLGLEAALVLAAMAAGAFAAAGWGGSALGLLAGTAAAFVYAGLCWALWKLAGIPAIIVSLSAGCILYSVSLEGFGAAADASALPRLRPDAPGFWTLALAVLAGCSLLEGGRRSAAGRKLLAATGNPVLARAIGIRVGLWQWLGLGLGNMFVFVSGLLHARHFQWVNVGDGVGFLMLAIFATILVANGLCPRVRGARNGLAVLGAVVLFQSVVAAALTLGISINLTKGLTGVLLLAAVALLRFRRVPHPLVLG